MKLKKWAALAVLMLMIVSMTACGKVDYSKFTYEDYAALNWEKKKIQYEYFTDAGASDWQSWYPIYVQLYKDGAVRITEYSFAPVKELVEYGNWKIENNELVIRYWKEGAQKAEKIKGTVEGTMQLDFPSKLSGKDVVLGGVSKAQYGSKEAFCTERSAGKTYSIRTAPVEKDTYKIAFIGDSITYGQTVSEEERYSALVAREPWVESVDNYGISGTTVTRVKNTIFGAEQCFVDRPLDFTGTPDVIVVFGGTNDFNLFDRPMGDTDSVDDETFCGALNSLAARLNAFYPDALVVFATPIHRLDAGYDQPNKAGYYLEDFRDAMVAVCEANGLPCIDLFNHPMLQDSDPDYDSLLSDKLHPNARGHEILADAMIEQLQAILF